MNPSIANRPLSLAAHLEQLASSLANNTVTYHWNHTNRCNCGLLAQQIGCSATSIYQAGQMEMVTRRASKTNWTRMATAFCPSTGRPLNEIFATLHDAGLRFEDYRHLEWCSDPTIIDRAASVGYRKRWYLLGFGQRVAVKVKPRHDAQPDVARYCATWAALIREHHTVEPLVADLTTPAEIAQAEQALQTLSSS